ncbi:MAG TPA: hypothetical protein VNQ90_04220 [Chthoniobacteraceae bacterium]|nr:hypothetical protein [Chthoniobacteraceae bacterium]
MPDLSKTSSFPDRRSLPLRRALGSLLPAIVMLGLLCPSQAQTSWEATGSGYWKDAGNWSSGAPSGTTRVNIINDGSKTVTVDNETPTAHLLFGDLYITGKGSATNELRLSNSDQWLESTGTTTRIDSAGLPSLGKIVNDGGLFRSTGLIRFGYEINGQGALEMISGKWEVSGINLGSHNAGTQGTLTMSGGSILLSDTLRVGAFGKGNGTATITGGILAAPSILMGATSSQSFPSEAMVDVSATGILETNSISLNRSSTNEGSTSLTIRDGGTVQFTSANPTITIRDGVPVMKIRDGVVSYRSVSDANIASGNFASVLFEGKNTFRLNDSSNLAVAGYLFDANQGAANYHRLELTGAAARWQSTTLTIGADGALSVFNATQATIAASTTSSGAISVTQSQLGWEGALTLQGGYQSDAAASLFTADVTVGTAGFLAGSDGSSFEFRGNLTNLSTETDSFHLLTSTVAFTTGATELHHLDLTGSASYELGLGGWRADNQAMGTVAIALGNQLALEGAAGVNALYVGALDLSEWATGEADLELTLQSALDLSAGVHLYYDPTRLENAYLSGLDYDLWGGGQLRAIPEPSALALACIALLAAVAVGQKKIAG